MKMRTKIKRKHELYVKVFSMLEVINPTGFSLTTSEKQVLALLYEKRDELVSEGVPLARTNPLLFNKEVADGIMETLDMPYNSYYNTLGRLKSKGLIEDKNILNPFYPDLMTHNIKDEYSFTMLIYS